MEKSETYVEITRPRMLYVFYSAQLDKDENHDCPENEVDKF